MTDTTESRLDEMAAQIAALQEEVATIKKRVRNTRKKLRREGGGGLKKKGEAVPDAV